jgi:hypothetical protein
MSSAGAVAITVHLHLDSGWLAGAGAQFTG